MSCLLCHRCSIKKEVDKVSFDCKDGGFDPEPKTICDAVVDGVDTMDVGTEPFALSY